MSQNIEIEFKNMLTEKEFHYLSNYFKLEPDQFKKQINHYFDTPSFTLKDKGSALRIREKGNEFELTLKQPAKQGLLETNQILTEGQANEALKTGKSPDGEVKDAVSDLISNMNELQYFGSLTTVRAEVEYKEGILVLDHSYYLNTEDFELEYEVTDESEGFRIFSNLLAELKIPVRQTDNKIKRFYAKKYNLLRE
ncbi:MULTISPECIES: CYTH domain-containing protein [unclassified Mesobacillus]|uniref:CYTH domain-containing protein n=1 Tax=unclassified Mesobacillus TaxID=2675270 RepID=UPI00203ED0D1|nr:MULTISPECIES: CYTH domain-containing protein [unclassified Mesobacillus]MCM3124830.1 CYTH domain-containing protein [Mesobacillus sp. MER 33]MCM3232861.1 CYTH domain-containing protein [Mesobacillus sp. MER 48]